MVKDPVCGMIVQESGAAPQLQYQESTYYFCTTRCKQSFEADPQRILASLRVAAQDQRKVVIVGAGEVGATFAFSLMMSGLASSIVLIDLNTARAEGHAMDLNHGLSFVQPAAISAGDYADCKDASIVMIAAGVAQKPGETRLELVRRNTEIYRTIIPRIVEFNPRILLIVTNPVDILTYVALKISEYPSSRVFGSGTLLDTARFRYLLSKHCRVDPRNVHAYILGEHGDSEVAVWSHVNIGGVPFREYCPVCEQSCSLDEKNQIFDQVKHAAYDIIDRKGATTFGISLALVRIAGAVLRNENSVLTLSTLLKDYHGISDVCLSVPVIINESGAARQLHVSLEEDETRKLQASARTVRQVIDTLGM